MLKLDSTQPITRNQTSFNMRTPEGQQITRQSKSLFINLTKCVFRFKGTGLSTLSTYDFFVSNLSNHGFQTYT